MIRSIGGGGLVVMCCSWTEIVDQMNTIFPGTNYHMGHAEWILNRYGNEEAAKAAGLKDMESMPSDSELERIVETFHKFDNDGSGTIDVEEMGLAMLAMV